MTGKTEGIKGNKARAYSLTITALMAALICIVSPFTIPIGPVPIGFANMVIFLAVILLGWKRGTLSVLIFELIGFVGVPVFSGFTGGAGKLLGPTGGYIVGYVIMAVIAGIIIEKAKGKKLLWLLAMVIGTVVLYAFGTVWFAYQAGITVWAALTMAVIPFIPGDIIKIIIALFFGGMLKDRLDKAGLL